MTVITTSRNAEDLSMTMVAEFDAAPERLWNLWEDPRKLQRWWGPDPYPATFTRYEFEPGGQCRYYMTGPEDSKHYGWWRIESIDGPHRIEFTMGLSGDDGEPVPGEQTISGVVTFERIGSGTRMTVLTQFPQYRADGADDWRGHGAGHAPGDRPDRSPARARPRCLITARPGTRRG